MKTAHYRAAYAESRKSLTVCPHDHLTVHQAAACIATAVGYVVAVEDAMVRRLTDAEEAEFQFAMRGHRSDSSKARAVCSHPMRAVRSLVESVFRRGNPPKWSRTETLERKMKTSHYRAAYAESFHCITTCSCPDGHQTVHQAAACISSAAGYVVAVENGLVRRLTDAEEVEFQYAMRGQRAESSKGRVVCNHLIHVVRSLVESAYPPSADKEPDNSESSPSPTT
jgi:hypothetical protein